MSKLEAMLRARKPPGVAGQRLDPQSPDAAIPRALRQLEEKQSARAIAREAGWSVNQLKQAWNL